MKKKIQGWAITDEEGRIFYLGMVVPHDYDLKNEKEYCSHCKKILEKDESLHALDIFEGLCIYYTEQQAKEALKKKFFKKNNLLSHLKVSQVEIEVL